jgi:hypothetical protein
MDFSNANGMIGWLLIFALCVVLVVIWIAWPLLSDKEEEATPVTDAPVLEVEDQPENTQSAQERFLRQWVEDHRLTPDIECQRGQMAEEGKPE